MCLHTDLCRAMHTRRSRLQLLVPHAKPLWCHEAPPRQRGGHLEHAAWLARRTVPGKRREQVAPVTTRQKLAQLQYGRMLQVVLQADQKVVFLDHRREVQSELQCRRLNAETDVGNTA